ncbi:hypothetical protein HEK616_02910 [Streptomyces nigrescens]|uniref:Uncharacterized protein n=1 Tax=Streptomyces nigrescens TaxID=1920 RepID=A0ABM7ZKC9_STRNI|nr:hypothetical protein HEK616_02910 [Streptomyces nigrescens]
MNAGRSAGRNADGTGRRFGGPAHHRAGARPTGYRTGARHGREAGRVAGVPRGGCVAGRVAGVPRGGCVAGRVAGVPWAGRVAGRVVGLPRRAAARVPAGGGRNDPVRPDRQAYRAPFRARNSVQSVDTGKGPHRAGKKRR